MLFSSALAVNKLLGVVGERYGYTVGDISGESLGQFHTHEVFNVY